jgi:hypothetical protein
MVWKTQAALGQIGVKNPSSAWLITKYLYDLEKEISSRIELFSKFA